MRGYREAVAVQPAARRFSVDEYHRMAEAGILGEDDRVELLEGEIVEMAPIGNRHATCVRKLLAFFAEKLRGRAIVDVQDPVRLDERSEPQPDVTLLAWREDWYAAAHPGPGDALLVVEVADTSAAWDLRRKVPLYARAGVAEVWVVDLAAGAVHIYRAPAGGAYAEVGRLGPGDVLAPAAFPDAAVDVAFLLG